MRAVSCRRRLAAGSATRPTCGSTSRWPRSRSPSGRPGRATPTPARASPGRTGWSPSTGGPWPASSACRRGRCPPRRSAEAFVLEVDAGRARLPGAVPAARPGWRWASSATGLPTSLLHAFVPPAVAGAGRADHERWAQRRGRPPAADPDRDLGGAAALVRPVRAGRPGRGPGRPATRRVVHRTRMSAARRRVARALRTLRRSLGDVDVRRGAGGARALARGVPPPVLAGARLRRPGPPARTGGVAGRQSVADVAAAVAALAADDEDEARCRYAHRRRPLGGRRGPRARELAISAVPD